MPESVLTHTASQEEAARLDRGGRSFAELMKYRFNLVLGSDRLGRNALDCELDELRISDVPRYRAGFAPHSHSFRYGERAPKLPVASKSPLLFEAGQAAEPVELGSRRHLFIDDVLLAGREGVELQVNSPHDPGLVNVPNFGDGTMIDRSGWDSLAAERDGDAAGDELGFVWRFNRAANVRQTELAVSRDGRNWRSYTNQAYLGASFEFLGRRVLETLSADGLVRRGDQLWQWASFNTGTHDGGGTNYLARLTQRLDGFVSLDGVAAPYRVTTRAFTFRGKRLRLNIASTGAARAGILNAEGSPIKDFSPADCDPIITDKINHVVSWGGRTDVSALAGKAVRLRFELPSAKLYAFAFGEHRLSDETAGR